MKLIIFLIGSFLGASLGFILACIIINAHDNKIMRQHISEIKPIMLKKTGLKKKLLGYSGKGNRAIEDKLYINSLN